MNIKIFVNKNNSKNVKSSLNYDKLAKFLNGKSLFQAIVSILSNLRALKVLLVVVLEQDFRHEHLEMVWTFGLVVVTGVVLGGVGTVLLFGCGQQYIGRS